MKKIDRQQLAAAAGRVLVLSGGLSAEREISLLSGQGVTAALRRGGLAAQELDVDGELVAKLLAAPPDLVVNMLHGKGGEDGIVQGVLAALGIPGTGSGVLASALAMDKARAKRLWQQQGLATPPFELLAPDCDWQQVLDRLGEVVVKPVSGGSSLGIAIARDRATLRACYEEARRYDGAVMAERYIAGAEYSVAILGADTLPAVGLRVQREFYDYTAKYEDQDTRLMCPADLTGAEERQLADLSRAAYHCLGCEGLARVDVMRGGDGGFSLLEVNTVPGMTSHSIVPCAARAMGMDYDELALWMVAERLARR